MDTTTTAKQQLSPTTIGILVCGVGAACAGAFIAARGGAGSESGAPFVMAATTPGLVLASVASATAGKRFDELAGLGRRLAWGLGLTLALLGIGLGWVSSSVVSLPDWPLAIVAAVVIAAPALLAGASVARAKVSDR